MFLAEAVAVEGGGEDLAQSLFLLPGSAAGLAAVATKLTVSVLKDRFSSWCGPHTFAESYQ